jgi:serine/threonine-protein kinase RsbW
MTDTSFPRHEFDAKRLILHLKLAIPADVKQIDPVVEKILWVVDRLKCGSGKEFEIETALRESLANAIVHGCKGDKRKEVQFAVACDEKRGIMIVVRDPGEGFDPSTLPSPIQGECLYSEHGRGIFLINQLMDEVRFARGGTEIHMRTSGTTGRGNGV